MTRRTCPACQRRYEGLVDPDCPVCRGVGVIALHPAAIAVSEDQPAVVARAIAIYLETTARTAAAELPLGGLRHDAIRVAAEKLREGRLIGSLVGMVPDEDPSPEPVDEAMRRLLDWEAARMAAGQGIDPDSTDLAALDEPPISYGPEDRPLAGGELPKASAAGYRCFLAMATDPRDPLGPDTQTLVYRDRAVLHRARVLAAACDRATTARRRLLARPGPGFYLVCPYGRGRHRGEPGQLLLFVVGLPAEVFTKGSAA